MERTLIINLKRSGDVLYSAHTVAALRRRSSVSLLVLEESGRAAGVLAGVDRVFTIDRRRILAVLAGAIHSDAEAVNQLVRETRPLMGIRWDRVLNHSNDPVAAHLASFLTDGTRGSPVGVSAGARGEVLFSNGWACLFNEFVTAHQASPLPFAALYRRIAGEPPPRGLPERPLLLNPAHEEKVAERLGELREGGRRALGVAVRASTPHKSIPEGTLAETLRLLRGEEGIVPVLVHAPDDGERALVRRIGERLDGGVATVECDLAACASVMAGLDALLTPDTSLKHLADLAGTPSVEVSLAESPLFKQASLHPASLVLTRPVHGRRFRPDDAEGGVPAGDVAVCCRHLLLGRGLAGLGGETAIYRTARDRLGPFLRLAYGRSDVFAEMTRAGARLLAHRILDPGAAGDPEDAAALHRELLRFGRENAADWARRELRRARDRARSAESLLAKAWTGGKGLWRGLDALLAGADEYSLAGLCLSLFRGRAENISASSRERGLSVLAAHLEGLERALSHAADLARAAGRAAAERGPAPDARP